MRVALVILLAGLAPMVSAQVLRSEAKPPEQPKEQQGAPLVLQDAANQPMRERTVDEAITSLREQMREIAEAALTDTERRDAYHALYESARPLHADKGVFSEAPPATADEAADRLERLFFEIALEAAGTAEARELLLEDAPAHITLEPVVPPSGQRRPVLILRDPAAEGDWWGDAKFDTEALALDEIEESPEEQLEPPEENIEEPELTEKTVAVELLADEKVTVEMHDDQTILREVSAISGDVVLFDALHIWLGGAVQYDAFSYEDLFNAGAGGGSEDDLDFRRAEVIMRSTLLDWGEVKLQWDVDGELWRDLYWRYVDEANNRTITVGNQKEGTSVENLLGNKFTSAQERSAPASTFGQIRGFGVRVNNWFERSEDEQIFDFGPAGSAYISTSLGIFGEDIEDTNDTDIAITGRVTRGSYADNGDGLHLGASATVRDGEFDRIAPRPEIQYTSRFDLARFDADTASIVGLEAMIVRGSLHAQAEAYYADYRGGSTDATGLGGYAQVGYYLTGEQRGYRPKWGLWAPLQVGARNVFEVFARASYTRGDADDAPSNDLRILTIGGSWYRHKYRTSLNLLYSETDRDVNGEDQGLGAVMRVQYLF
ncbi:MAG: porin [Halieaceae bacterium]|nr:porin [Halieaceae bacterium]